MLDRAVLTDPNSRIITLLARQSGVVVSYNFDFRFYCYGVRQGTVEPKVLSITLLNNPTTNEYIDFEVRGAEGQTLQINLIDEQGRLLNEMRINEALRTESQRIQLGTSAGIYYLQATTPDAKTSAKVLKR